jgi:hypothetical protein
MKYYSFFHSIELLEEEVEELRTLDSTILEIIGGHDGWVVVYQTVFDDGTDT